MTAFFIIPSGQPPADALALRMKFWTDFRPATGALAALVCFLAVGAAAETTNTLSDAEIQGRQLARQICSARPSEYFFTNTGILKIQDGKGIKYEFTL